jgi:hypothetical protein
VSERPRLRIDSSRLPDHDLTFMLTTPRAWRRFTLEGIEEEGLPVPTDGPVTIRVAGWGIGDILVRVLPVPLPGTEAFEHGMHLEWFPARAVTARFVGPDNSPALAWLELSRFPGWEWPTGEMPEESGPAQAEAEAQVRKVGTVEVIVTPLDPTLASHRRLIRITDDSPQKIDLGVIELERALEVPPLQLLVPEKPDGWYDVYCWKNRIDHWLTAGPDGVVDVPAGLLAEGDVIVLGDQSGGLPGMTHRLTGPGPWAVSWPGARAHIEVRGADGSTPEGVWVLIDDRYVLDGSELPYLEHGHALLPGPHELAVSAPGFKTKVHRIILEDGEERTVKVVLNRSR